MLTDIKRNTLILVVLIIIVFIAGVLLNLFLPIFENMFKEALMGRISAAISVLTFLVFGCLLVSRIFLGKWVFLNYSLALFAYIIFSSLANIYLVLSESSADYRWILSSISLPLIYISMTGVVRNSTTLVRFLWALLLINLVIVILLTFTDVNGHFPSFNGVLTSRYRVFMLGSSYGPIALATLAASTFLLSFGLYIFGFSGNIASNLFLLVSFGFSVIGLVAASGRTSWVGTFIACVVLIYFSRKYFKKKKMTWNALLRLIIIVIIVITILVFWSWNFQIQDRFLTLLSTLFSPSQDISMDARFSLWNSAFGLLIANPFGVGSSYFMDMYGKSTHNEYLHILLSTGVPGFILYYWFWISNISTILKEAFSRKINEYSRIIMITIPILILMAIVSLTEAWSNSNSIAALIFWVVLSIGAVASYQHKRIQKDGE